MYNDILISLQEATVTLRVSKDLVVVMLKFVKTQRAPACRTAYIHLLLPSPPSKKIKKMIIFYPFVPLLFAGS